jgi:phenylacetyl-CoA:acceptor oxidoreductase subunit 1
MVIDLRKCIGCNSCTIACKETNKVPSNIWRRVTDCGLSDYPERQRLFLPMSCMHCTEPPCLKVCPTGATYQRPDGIVEIDYERCLGCGYCIIACPYQARTIFKEEYEFSVNAILEGTDMHGSALDRIGVCTKCNFCRPCVETGLSRGLRPGIDPEATPACVVTCSANALYFGDLNDPHSVVSRLIEENKTFSLQEELKTGPSVYYIID